ncbi:MAG: hypothetical protein ACOY71_03615 [Gemmatimonadota bacterium]
MDSTTTLAQVVTAVTAALAPETAEGRRLLLLLVTSRRWRASGDALAEAIGLPSRQGLNRLLAAEGWPPVATLRTWVRLVRWVVGSERDGTTLAAWARYHGVEAGALHRLVKRQTGLSWSDVLARGSGYLIAELALVRRRRRGRATGSATGTLSETGVLSDV